MPDSSVCRVCGRKIYKRSKGWVHSDNRRVSQKPRKHYATPGGTAKSVSTKGKRNPRTGAGGFNIFGI